MMRIEADGLRQLPILMIKIQHLAFQDPSLPSAHALTHRMAEGWLSIPTRACFEPDTDLLEEGGLELLETGPSLPSHLLLYNFNAIITLKWQKWWQPKVSGLALVHLLDACLGMESGCQHAWCIAPRPPV